MRTHRTPYCHFLYLLLHQLGQASSNTSVGSHEMQAGPHVRERDPKVWNTASDSPVDETNTATHSSQQEARRWTADDKDCKWRAMSSFEKLYLDLFPHTTQDCLSNYVHVRLVKPPSPKSTTQVDLVRPILGPVTRSSGSRALCVLKCISVPLHDDGAQRRLLREVAIHRSITLGSSPAEECILPLLSHFTSRSIFGGAPGIFLVLVLPYCPQGTLFDYFALRRACAPATRTGPCETTVDESELRWTIGEVVKALHRCHSRGIVHRDVKAENILLWEGKRKGETNDSMRLLLCDFGLSTWTEDEEHGVQDDGGDSTLCGTWDYLSPETATLRQTGPAVDIWALGCLCVLLLTGSLPFASSLGDDTSSSSDVRVESRLLQDRVEKLAVGDWEEVRARLPRTLTYDCADIIEGMLQVDQKCRLTVERILAHPFMKPSLRSTPLRPLQQTGNTLPSGTAKATNTKPLSDVGNGSSTTLRSVLQRMDPGLFVAAGESVVEQRKTPFGLVRVAKEKGEGTKPDAGLERLFTTDEQRLAWGSGLGTRGLVSVRQRIKGGKIELTRDGSVMLSTPYSCIVIAADGSRIDALTAPPDGSVAIGKMYNSAANWLERRRRKSTLAGFLLSPLRENGSSAVDHIAYCSVKGNGPLPDYEVRFAAVETGQNGRERQVDEWNVEIQVLVQRAKGTVVVHARVQGGAQKGEASWKECVIPIKRVALDRERTRWVSVGTSQSSLVIADLSKREMTALERSLDAAQAVDTVFATLCGSS